MEQKINSRREAIDAFILEFGTLARALNPAAPAFDGYDFIKYAIRINDGKPMIAYIAHDKECTTTCVVPVDGSTPSIEDFKAVKVVKKIRTAEQACDAFIAEYGTLARVLNPCAPAYSGFVFEKRTICFRKNRFKAFIAVDTPKTTVFIVPTNGEAPEIADYSEVKILPSKSGNY